MSRLIRLTSTRRSAPSGARVLAVLVAALVALPSGGSLSAQQSTHVLTGRVSGSVYGQGSDPRGDFGKNTGAGWGGGGSVVLRFDQASISNLRGDISFLTYGNSSRRIPLAGTGGLVKLDLNTSNNIVSVVAGPQLGGTAGPFSPYVALLGGFSVFWTQSSVEGTSNDNQPFASTTNSSDAVLAYGGAAGLYIRVYNGARPVRVELGARLLRHDNVSYLNDDRVRDAFANDRDPIPVRGRADFVTYHAGVSVVLW